ncbi:MAG: nicotinamide-nucleotide amidase [Pseudomonadota bacterium]
MTEKGASGLEQLANEVAQLLHEQKLRLAVAESCTGGWVAMALTGVVGSSEWFDRGFVTYSNQAKQQMLGVLASTLETYGAVSEQTVAEMTQGALTASGADATLAISGIAGPGGGTPEKPVGTVCFAWQLKQAEAVTATQWFAGDRQAVRRQAVEYALKQLLEVIKGG